MADYIFLLETRFTSEQQAVVNYLETTCRQAGMNLYLIGGPMRDLLAGAPVRVLDFCVEGNPLHMQKTLLAHAEVQLLFADQQQQTLRLRMRGVRFRISGAHAEFHEKPNKPPVRRPAPIIDDLRRRGFTIDAIGLSLNPGSRGLLLDPTNGMADIEARQIRMIHNYVFLEDPVLCLRAVRLQTRLGFTIEERTQARITSARENRYLEEANRDLIRAGLARELEALAYEPDPAPVLKQLEEQHLLDTAFGKNVLTSKMSMEPLSRLPNTVQRLEDAGISPDQGPVVLHLMFGSLPSKDQGALTELPMSGPLVEGSRNLLSAAKNLEKTLLGKNAANLAQVHDLLRHSPSSAVLYLALCGSAPVQKKLEEYTQRLPELKLQLPLRELQQLGVNPSAPEFHTILDRIYHKLMEGKLRTEEERLEALRQEAIALGIDPNAAREKAAREKAAREKEEKPRGRGVGRPRGTMKPTPKEPAPAAPATPPAVAQPISKEVAKEAKAPAPPQAKPAKAKTAPQTKAAPPAGKPGKPSAKPVSGKSPVKAGKAPAKPAAGKTASKPAKTASKAASKPAGKPAAKAHGKPAANAPAARPKATAPLKVKAAAAAANGSAKKPQVKAVAKKGKKR